ncbi:MAG: hybrid sensor histidine kinase/response regulator [Gemmataceae bacterium]
MPQTIRRRTYLDLAVVFAIAAALYLLARLVDLAEQLTQLMKRAEAVELDELLVVSLLLVPLLLVVVWRQQIRVTLAMGLKSQIDAADEANRRLEGEVQRRVEVEQSLREMIQLNDMHLREISSIYVSAPIGLCSVDRDLRYKRINRRMAEMNGISLDAHFGRTLPEMLPHLADRLVPLYRSVLDTGRPVLDQEVESAMPDAPGVLRSWLVSYYPLTDPSGTVVGVNAIVYETTERKRMDREARLLAVEVERVQKLQGLDILVGGIAHDFNNLLMVILVCLEYCRDSADLSELNRNRLQEAEKAGLRAADICRELLTYTGRSRPVFEVFRLNDLMRSVARMLRTNTPDNVTLVVRDWPTAVQIEGDEGQITQVMMNLVINAIHAIGEKQGRVTLALAVDPAGSFARLVCQDDGCGLDEVTRARLFEPFFTTKPNGRGLGLSAVQGIVQRHNGAIAVSSKVGVGTTFTVTLPLVAGLDAAPAALSPSWQGVPALGRLFLVVDDDPVVRNVTAAGLKKLGGLVLEAPDGQAACELVERTRPKLSGCLIDYHMRGLNGVETYRRLRLIYPAVPVIVMSGNLVREAEDAVHGDRHAATMHKPYSIAKSVEVLNRLAAAPGPA